MSMQWLFALLFLFASVQCYRYMHLDKNEHKDKVRFCEISGYVDEETYKVHGELRNCHSPPMNCTIPADEGLTKDERNIECRDVVDDDWFFHNDSECAFRFYYMRTKVCEQKQCFSIAITCVPITNPKFLFYICELFSLPAEEEIQYSGVMGVLLFTCILPISICYYCFNKYYHSGNYKCRDLKTAIDTEYEEKPLHEIAPEPLPVSECP
uniref:CX domain-containing protein n=1 Tax=Caenorhabditis tropicalis TaxID=1561998 RepID=A0A1I7SYB1_9PELO